MYVMSKVTPPTDTMTRPPSTFVRPFIHACAHRNIDKKGWLLVSPKYGKRHKLRDTKLIAPDLCNHQRLYQH